MENRELGLAISLFYWSKSENNRAHFGSQEIGQDLSTQSAYPPSQPAYPPQYTAPPAAGYSCAPPPYTNMYGQQQHMQMYPHQQQQVQMYPHHQQQMHMYPHQQRYTFAQDLKEGLVRGVSSTEGPSLSSPPPSPIQSSKRPNPIPNPVDTEEGAVARASFAKGPSLPPSQRPGAKKRNNTFQFRKARSLLKTSGEPKPKKGGGGKSRTSPVWRYFQIENGCMAICNICKSSLAFKKHHGTSNLYNHLKSKHHIFNTTAETIGTAEIEQARSNFFIQKMSATTGRNRTSPVWGFFEIKDDGMAICNICKASLVFKNSWASNLNKHLRSKHHIIFTAKDKKKKKDAEAGRASSSEGSPPSSPSRGTKLSKTTIQNYMDAETGAVGLVSSTEGSQSANYIDAVEAKLEGVSPPLSPTQITRRGRTKTRKYTESKQKFDARNRRKSTIDDMVLQMIYVDMVPFSIVEDEGFCEFVYGLEKRYELPSRTTIAKRLTDVYSAKKDILENVLSETSAVSLTTEMWSSRKTRDYLTVTAHFINSDWELQSCVLATRRITDCHTGEEIAADLQDIMEEWKITEKVNAIVSDNAANMYEATRLLKVRHMACFAHTLHLIVTYSLEQVHGFDLIRRKIKNIVSFFQHSVDATNTFESQQMEAGDDAEPKKLVMDVENRWNSTFYMLKRYIELHTPVTNTLCLFSRQDMTLDQSDLHLITSVIEALQPLEEITREMSSEKITTVSKVIPLVSLLQDTLKDMSAEMTGITLHLTQMLQRELCAKFPNLQDFLWSAPTYLDPRFKKFIFTDQDCLLKIQDRLKSQLKVMDDTPTGTDELPAAQDAPKSVWDKFDKKIATHKQKSSNAVVRLNLEMQCYLEEDSIDRQSDPLEWWKKNGTKFPLLRAIAKQCLSCPVLSVPYERAFSSSGELFSYRRSCLPATNVDKIIFLNGNIEV